MQTLKATFLVVCWCALARGVLVNPSPYLGPPPLQPTTVMAASSDSRSCTENPVLAPAKGFKKSKHPLPADPPPTCLETKGQPIEIQEFLQSKAREWQWRIGETHASEDSWSFVRYLSDEELAKYGDASVLVEPVIFTSGKAAIMVRTTELSDGYVRVQIAMNIQAEGKPSDKTSPQPGSRWPVVSKGTLEQELSDALQTRNKTAQ